MNIQHLVAKSWAIICLLLGPLALSACETTSNRSDPSAEITQDGGLVLFRTAADGSTQIPTTGQANLGSFQPGDSLGMKILGVEDTEVDLVVGTDGIVDFPIIGQRQVSGKTPSDVQKELKAVYGKDYFVNPTVIITRDAAPIGEIVIDGFVKEPGIHKVFDRITLRQALAMVGGLQEDANAKRVIVARLDGQDRIGLEYSLKRIREQGAPDPVILPGDVIYVDNDQGKIFWREVVRTSPLIALFTRF